MRRNSIEEYNSEMPQDVKSWIKLKSIELLNSGKVRESEMVLYFSIGTYNQNPIIYQLDHNYCVLQYIQFYTLCE